MPPFRPAGLSRRSFITGAGVTVLAAACSSASRARKLGQQVVVANHPLYIDAATNRGFERTTGTHVEYHEEITDDRAWLASVTPQLARGESIDRDVVVVSDWVEHRLADRGFLSQPGVPWALGMVGVAYDRRATGTDLRRMAELFQPALQGRVALPADMRQALGIALLADRVDPANVTIEQATATAGRLANSVKLGQVRFVDRTRPIDELVNGTAAAAVVAASDTVGLEHDHPDLRFVIPEEGGLLLTDVVAIPARPPNLDAARAYVEYATSTTVAVERFRALPVLWPPGPIDDGIRTTAPEVYGDPRRNPPPDVRARLHSFRYLDETDDVAFAAVYKATVEAAVAAALHGVR